MGKSHLLFCFQQRCLLASTDRKTKTRLSRPVFSRTLDITDKLPTSYHHITNCRPTVGRLSGDCRPTDSLCFGENLSAVCRPTDGQQTADRRPTVGQQTADSRPTGFLGELFFTITQHQAVCLHCIFFSFLFSLSCFLQWNNWRKAKSFLKL